MMIKDWIEYIRKAEKAEGLEPADLTNLDSFECQEYYLWLISKPSQAETSVA